MHRQTAGKFVLYSSTLPLAKHSHVAFHAHSNTMRVSFGSTLLSASSLFIQFISLPTSFWLQKLFESPQAVSVCRISFGAVNIVHSGSFILECKNYMVYVLCYAQLSCFFFTIKLWWCLPEHVLYHPKYLNILKALGTLNCSTLSVIISCIPQLLQNYF